MFQIKDQISVNKLTLSELRPTSLVHSYEAWGGLKKISGDLPSWPGIDFLLSVPSSLVSSAMVLKLSDSIEDSKYLFWGSGLNWVSGMDMTNKSPFEINSSDIKQYIEHTLMPTIEIKKPHFYETEFMGKAGLRLSESILRLPFGNEDGRIEYIATLTLLTNRKRLGKHSLTV